MSALVPAMVRTFRVGRYTATLSIPAVQPGGAACAVVEWSPCIPDRLSEKELAQYRRGRDAALLALAKETCAC